MKLLEPLKSAASIVPSCLCVFRSAVTSTIAPRIRKPSGIGHACTIADNAPNPGAMLVAVWISDAGELPAAAGAAEALAPAFPSPSSPRYAGSSPRIVTKTAKAANSARMTTVDCRTTASADNG
jgi:hypothetical protein